MSVLDTLREAVHGSRQDFTDGPIGRSLVLLAEVGRAEPGDGLGDVRSVAPTQEGEEVVWV